MKIREGAKPQALPCWNNPNLQKASDPKGIALKRSNYGGEPGQAGRPAWGATPGQSVLDIKGNFYSGNRFVERTRKRQQGGNGCVFLEEWPAARLFQQTGAGHIRVMRLCGAAWGTTNGGNTPAAPHQGASVSTCSARGGAKKGSGERRERGALSFFAGGGGTKQDRRVAEKRTAKP